MVDFEKVTIGGRDLCKTFSTIGNKLYQVETGITYGKECYDLILGYVGGKPYSRYTYEETDEPDDPDEPIEQQ